MCTVSLFLLGVSPRSIQVVAAPVVLAAVQQIQEVAAPVVLVAVRQTQVVAALVALAVVRPVQEVAAPPLLCPTFWRGKAVHLPLELSKLLNVVQS